MPDSTTSRRAIGRNRWPLRATSSVYTRRPAERISERVIADEPASGFPRRPSHSRTSSRRLSVSSTVSTLTSRLRAVDPHSRPPGDRPGSPRSPSPATWLASPQWIQRSARHGMSTRTSRVASRGDQDAVPCDESVIIGVPLACVALSQWHTPRDRSRYIAAACAGCPPRRVSEPVTRPSPL